MKVEKTNLEGVLNITLDAFEDHRGYYIETYNEYMYKTEGINVDFIQDDISVSKKMYYEESMVIRRLGN